MDDNTLATEVDRTDKGYDLDLDVEMSGRDTRPAINGGAEDDESSLDEKTLAVLESYEVWQPTTSRLYNKASRKRQDDRFRAEAWRYDLTEEINQ